MRNAIRVFLVLLAVGPGAARGEEALPYAVTVEGVADGLAEAIRQQSRLVDLANEPPDSRAALQRRANDDVNRIQQVLRSLGYYDGKVDISLGEGQPVPVVIAVSPGTLYTLQAYDVHGIPQPDLADLGLELGQPAAAEPVIDAQAKLLKSLAEAGHPLAKVVDRRVVVDHATRSMRVEVTMDPGPLARFGPVEVTGLEKVGAQAVRGRIPWERGEVFSVDQVEALRKKLVDSRLFSSVRISTAHALNDEGLLPITIDLREAKMRSIGLGADWSSSTGFGGKAFWEHRNLLGGGEDIRASVTAAQTRNALDISYREPDFLAANQSLLLTTTAEEQRTDAFVTRTLGMGAGVSWDLTPTWTATASTALERTFEEEQDVTTNFTLVSFPLELAQDDTDDLLDPTTGNRLRGTVRPFLDPPGSAGFTKLDLYDSHYWLLRKDAPRLVAAGWGRVGAIRGASLQEVPADKRFYVGGGGSVRPFGYQMAGPVDSSGHPTGGLAAIAFGGEIRVRVTDTIGVVPFVEAGRADRSHTPSFDGELFWGAGLGVRYHTPIGPVRADIAFPVKPRRNVDDAFQIYLSLGQAF